MDPMRYHLRENHPARGSIVPKRSRVVLLDIALDRASAVPLQRQVYLGIRRLILTGRLKLGAHLPSTRYLASELRVARTTVLDAFGQLMFEGYLEGKVGSGTRVSSHVPDDVQTLALITEQYPVPSLHRKPRIARRTAPYALQRVAKPIRPLRPDCRTSKACHSIPGRGSQPVAPGCESVLRPRRFIGIPSAAEGHLRLRLRVARGPL